MSRALSLALLVFGWMATPACGSSDSTDSGAAPSGSSEVSPTRAEPLKLADLDGVWAEVPSTAGDRVLPNCQVIPANDIPSDFFTLHPDLSSEPAGGRYVELRDGSLKEHWMVYKDGPSCLVAVDFHQPGLELIRQQSTLTPTAQVFFEDDGTAVQEIRQDSVLSGGTIFSMYVLLKSAPGTSSYKEFLRSDTTSSSPFSSLGGNGGWWHYRQPR